MAGAGPSAHAKSICALDRYLIDDLASQLKPFLPGSDVRSIAALLRSDVNNPADKVASNLKGQFTPEDSISGFEAFTYAEALFVGGTLHDGSPSSRLAQGLFAIYLGDADPLGTTPPPHRVVMKRCHDGDTCTIVETQDAGCHLPEVWTNVRVSGIDAPELGVYYGPWVNQKLVENVDKLRREWLGDIRLPKETLALVNKLIATRIDYTGKLAGLIRSDLNKWNGTDGVPRILEESQIEWVWDGAGDKTPPILCGTWQPFDKYARRLGSFYQVEPSFLEMYLRARLPELMASEGKKKYQAYREKVQPLLQRLRSARQPQVQHLLRTLENNLPNPEVIFSAAACAAMATKYEEFRKAHGAHAEIDDQVLQILTGSVYGYEKYRNQDGDVYQAANDIARREGFGFWTEETFRTLYGINERDVRYHPPHCRAP